MTHIVLLGDSIFDNAGYVHQERGEEPVIDCLRTEISRGSAATLLAHDGNVTRDVRRQLEQMPKAASHLVISVGGNDALALSDILLNGAHSVGEALESLAEAQTAFRHDYSHMLQSVCALRKPLLVCTVYDKVPLSGFNDVPGGPRALLAALSLFNDVIIDEAVRARVPILDLRRVCDQSTDYSDISPIEPSATGSAKIAKAIWRIVATHDFSRRHAVVFGNEFPT
jgi:hypothetical protein